MYSVFLQYRIVSSMLLLLTLEREPNAWLGSGFAKRLQCGVSLCKHFLPEKSSLRSICGLEELFGEKSAKD